MSGYKESRDGIDIYKMYIDGGWHSAGNGAAREVENPTNQDIIATVPMGDDSTARAALESAAEAQKSWKLLPPRKRAEHLYRLTAEIRENRERLAELLTREQGKLYKTALGEVDVTCTFIEYACEWARRIEGDIVPSDNPDEQIHIHKVPYGVTVGITAWNFPLALAARKIGPALVAGNTMVVKPTTETPLATLELAKLAQDAGLPKGVLNVVTGYGRELGDALVKNPITRLVTMTGSTYAGQQIFRSAADNMIAVRLELGGKAPFIVMEDADINGAVHAAVAARFGNCGQVCTCNERMYLHEKIYDEFMEKFLNITAALKIGDPMDADTDIGPKVNSSELTHLENLVIQAIDEGASVLLGGKKPDGPRFEKGYWYEPTILTDVRQEMNIVHEESFGPVLPVLKVSDFEQAMAYANDCDYGLSAYFWSKDLKRIMRLRDELEFGEIYVNRSLGEQHQGFHNGYKRSGTGGEDGKYGFENYLEKKTFYINYDY